MASSQLNQCVFNFKTVQHCLTVPSRVPVRCLQYQSNYQRQKFSPQYKWDQVSPEHSLIYESSYAPYIHALYATVAGVGVSSAVLIAIRWENMLSIFGTGSRNGFRFLLISSAMVLGLGVLYNVARTVPVRIYHHPRTNEFVAVRRTCLGQLRQLVYSSQDVKLTKSKDNKNVDISADVLIKGQKCFLTADDFVSPVFYNAHLGIGYVPKDLTSAYVGRPKF